MDKLVVAVLVILWFLIGLAFGYSGAIYFERKPFQDAAVERGYAEWVVPKAGRGETVFHWVDGKPETSKQTPEDDGDIPF